MSSSPEPTNNPAPKKSSSTSSVTSDEKGEYVQIDEEETQALQKTIQSSRPSKDAKLCETQLLLAHQLYLRGRPAPKNLLQSLTMTWQEEPFGQEATLA
ncbi:GRB2-associated-binding protein 2 [Cricetulus griseus]|nr:GRB2-associated-binding protein 2 [Cricetulus griseus]